MSDFGYDEAKVATVRSALSDLNTKFTAAKEELSAISGEVLNYWDAPSREDFTAKMTQFETDSQSLADVTTKISNWLDEMVARYDNSDVQTSNAVDDTYGA